MESEEFIEYFDTALPKPRKPFDVIIEIFLQIAAQSRLALTPEAGPDCSTAIVLIAQPF